MKKMSEPKMDVVRFNESDVIVASGGFDSALRTLSVTGVGDGEANNALFAFGGKGGTWSSKQIEFSDSSYVNSINSYLGVDASNRRICLDVPLATGGYASYPLRNLAGDELSSRDNNFNVDYNGDYTWNGSHFIHQ